MKTRSSTHYAAVILLLTAVSLHLHSSQALGGSGATLAVVYGSTTTVCGIVAEQPIHQIQCSQNGILLPPFLPTTSFDVIAGGRDTLCGVYSGGLRLMCWNTSTAIPKRIYNSSTTSLISLTIGDTGICALTNVTASENSICWRPNYVPRSGNSGFRVVSSGIGFDCGVLESNNQVLCWNRDGDDDAISSSMQSEFANFSMVDIQIGGRHACGIDDLGFVICKGNNDTGQLNVPSNSAYEYRGLALGENHSCAIRRLNRTVICWGGNGESSSNITDGIPFESIVAGLNFTCGLTSSNFSVICWGIGWPNLPISAGVELPLRKTLPGPCLDTSCPCNVYPNSQSLCSGNGNICRPCDDPVSIPPTPSPPLLPPPASPSRGLPRGLLAFAIVGAAGGLAAILIALYCLWSGACLGKKKKIHDSVQPRISASTPSSRSSTLKRQVSILMRRQRSGTSWKHADTAVEMLLSELVSATNNFASENKIGGGDFYKGKLQDGREVAVKRTITFTGSKAKKLEEEESAFESELALLSRLHHKHLVRLVGYCQERDERLLVYEYMNNGSLHDHLHGKNNVEKSSSPVNSWKMRIKIALESARGIDYLHNYAVPPIIHRDIKSSNILLDSSFTAKVSDFGLSSKGPESDDTNMAATGSDDVYCLGVVLLEGLTGKKAVFKEGTDDDLPRSLVEYAVPAIMAGELTKILDGRVGPLAAKDTEAVELTAYTAVHCVDLESKDRLTMNDVVVNLERALSMCEDSPDRNSSNGNSIVSDVSV